MNAKEWLLKIANEVEKDPARWTKGDFAKNASGHGCWPDEQEAVCWCAVGFLKRDNPGHFAGACLRNASGFDITHIFNDKLNSPSEFVSWFRNAATLAD